MGGKREQNEETSRASPASSSPPSVPVALLRERAQRSHRCDVEAARRRGEREKRGEAKAKTGKRRRATTDGRRERKRASTAKLKREQKPVVIFPSTLSRSSSPLSRRGGSRAIDGVLGVARGEGEGEKSERKQPMFFPFESMDDETNDLSAMTAALTLSLHSLFHSTSTPLFLSLSLFRSKKT